MAQLFKKYFAERNTREYSRKNEFSSRVRIELNEIIVIAKNILNRKYGSTTKDNEQHIKLINSCKVGIYKNMIDTFRNYNNCFKVSDDDESDTESDTESDADSDDTCARFNRQMKLDNRDKFVVNYYRSDSLTWLYSKLACIIKTEKKMKDVKKQRDKYGYDNEEIDEKEMNMVVMREPLSQTIIDLFKKQYKHLNTIPDDSDTDDEEETEDEDDEEEYD
jgi:hypothetical protein